MEPFNSPVEKHKDGPPKVGLDLIMGEGTSVKIGNLLRNVKEDKLELQSGIYRKGKVNFEKEPG